MVLLLLSVALFCVSVMGAPKPQIIDLGYPMDNNTIFWPGVQRFNIILRTRQIDQGGIPWFAVNTFETAEHVGTHIDAPFHFNETGWKLGNIPEDRFFTKAVLIDVSAEVGDNRDFDLLPSHITKWEKENGMCVPEGSVVLVRFGWSKKYYTNYNQYFGITNNDSSKLNFPGLSPMAAGVFVNRKVYGVGLDTPSLDSGKNVTFNAHRVLLGANKFGLENLNLTSPDLPIGSEFKLHILPIKITEGTGAPSRVIAFVGPETKTGKKWYRRDLNCDK
ncbi:kynurenine formamidase-like [Periplaneta americana]|uniref:kynurenine formamidase-like n=1 Tax=Periplaneta americana TaxID=6978 RepID=UPI0037E86C7A